MDAIPITSLTPESAPPAEKSIRAIVTLSWPFSSSTKQCALLLAEPDFRLRNRKGQVRVRFTGASAEAVANSHVGIGDEVVLALDGALWEQDSEASRTPGKSVDGELVYRRRLAMSVVRGVGNVQINVDAPVSPPRSPEKPVEIVTPLPKAVSGLRQSVDGTAESLPNYTYASPAFAKRLRLSGESFLNSAYDPFAVGDFDIEESHERNRTTFGTNLRWRYAEKTPSPKKVHFAQDGIEVDEGQESPRAEVESPSKDPRAKAKMLPPPLPYLQMPASKPVESSVEQQEGPSTPKIRPVQSPTLPLPSPFPMETRQVQFGLVEPTTSPRDRTQDSTTSAETQAEVHRVSMHKGRREDDVAMLDQHSDVANEASQEYLSDTEPDDELTQQALLERHGVSVYDGATEDGGEMKTMARPVHASHIDVVEHVVEKPAESMSEMPRTPEKAPTIASQHRFGLDGTSSTPQSVHVTPQSEKEKEMARTLSSLFGFQGSSEPASRPPERPFQEPEGLTPAAWFSDMSRSGLETDGNTARETERRSFEAAMEELVSPKKEHRIEPPEDQSHGEALQQRSQIAQQQPLPSAGPSQIEVIDLASSSESGDDHPHQSASVSSVAQNQIPEPEIQGSLAASRGNDLLAQENRELRGQSDIHERRAQASKLREMVAEVASEKTFPAPLLETGLVDAKEADDDIQADPIEVDKSGSILVEQVSPSKLQSPGEEISTTSLPERPMEMVSTESHEQIMPLPRQSVETPPYPNLPLSPSNSQSLRDMHSQEAAGTISETTTSLLPPTPQLTQVDSFSQTHARASQLSASPRLEMAKPSSQIKEVVEEELSSRPQEKTPKKLSSSQQQDITEEETLAQSQKRTPARKSLSTRLSNVPDVISPWFSPKRSSAASLQENKAGERIDIEDDSNVPRAETQHVKSAAQTSINGHMVAQPDQIQASRIDTNGLSTALSYFTPLSRLEELLNPSSQQAYGTTTIDILAVVADRTKEPVRAKKGPRDHYTIFKVSDHSLSAESSVRVEIYRPWMATLPVASEGDVILLRAFSVKSRNGQPYLLSTDASAWCVWRYEDHISGRDNDGRPIWAQRRASGGVLEEIKGPPVELGDEERKHVSRLREWWQAVRSVHDSDTMATETGLNGLVNEPVAAKL